MKRYCLFFSVAAILLFGFRAEAQQGILTGLASHGGLDDG